MTTNVVAEPLGSYSQVISELEWVMESFNIEGRIGGITGICSIGSKRVSSVDENVSPMCFSPKFKAFEKCQRKP